MGNTLNKTLFTLTYNEQADKAYNDQLKASEKSVQNIKNQLQQYRKQREDMIRKDTASDYYSVNSEQYLTTWDKWLQKNSNLAEGDYAAKQTEIKTIWESLTNVNQMAIEMGRVPKFIDFYMKDKQDNLTSEQKKSFDKLKEEANKYLTVMNKQAPADIISKRDELNTQFGTILKTIDDKFKSPTDPKSLLQGISNDFYTSFVEKVKTKEKAEEKTFSIKRGLNTTWESTAYFLDLSFRIFFAFLFAIIVSNDMIGRPPMYRVFFFIFTFLLILVPFYSLIIIIGLSVYYIYRAITGTSPVIFSILPLYPKIPSADEKMGFFTFRFNVFKKGNVAIDKEFDYFTQLATTVNKPMTPTILEEMAQSNSPNA